MNGQKNSHVSIGTDTLFVNGGRLFCFAPHRRREIIVGNGLVQTQIRCIYDMPGNILECPKSTRRSITHKGQIETYLSICMQLFCNVGVFPKIYVRIKPCGFVIDRLEKHHVVAYRAKRSPCQKTNQGSKYHMKRPTDRIVHFSCIIPKIGRAHV